MALCLVKAYGIMSVFRFMQRAKPPQNAHNVFVQLKRWRKYAGDQVKRRYGIPADHKFPHITTNVKLIKVSASPFEKDFSLSIW